MKLASAAAWLSMTIVTVALVFGVGYLIRTHAAAPALAATAAPLAADGAYFVFLSQIEVESRKPNSRRWDITDSGPDLRYDVYWKDTRVFRSSVCKDTLLARWDADEIGLSDVVAGVSPERTVKAARIGANRGAKIEFRIFDDDLARDDPIGSFEVAVEALQTGNQTWTNPAPGIRSVTCRVLRPGEDRR